LIFLVGYLVPDHSFASLYVVSGFPSTLFSYLSTTFSLLCLLFLLLHSVIWCISLMVPLLSSEFCAHYCNCCLITWLKVTRGQWENGRNFLCDMGATQPIGIFLPPASRKSTPLHRFNILPLSRMYTQLCGFGGALSHIG